MRLLLAMLVLAVVAAAQPLPEKPKPAKVVDSKFLLATSFTIGTAALDVHSTRHCFNVNPRCTEGLGIFAGGRPSTAQLVAVNLPMQFGINGIGYMLKKHGKRYWWVPQVAFNVVRIAVVARNYRLAGR